MAAEGRTRTMFPQTKKCLLVAAIDFGTTYTGWAFSFKHDYERDPMKIQTATWGSGKLQSSKAPTSILIKPDGKTFDSFGYEAEERHSELVSKQEMGQWYFFQNFKMVLHGKGVHRHTQLKDISGKELAALAVFGLCIRFLKDNLLKVCTDRMTDIRLSDIQWVLTVPAIWDDGAKQFMREAAVFAGIDTEQLFIALEPECASICCRHNKVTKSQTVHEFPVGTKYMVVDAGGGTVDIITHQIEDNRNLKPSGGDFRGNRVKAAFMKFMDKRSGDTVEISTPQTEDNIKLKECSKPSGGDCGGNYVNAAFMKFMDEYFGVHKMSSLKEEDMEGYMDLLKEFEFVKRSYKGNDGSVITIRLPHFLAGTEVAENDGAVKVQKDKLRLSSEILGSIFHDTINKIIVLITELLQHKDVADCTYILLAGGFSDSELLKNTIRSTFREKTVIIPDDAGLAVLKGAVIYGHMTSIISQRVCRYTYGTDVTHDYDNTCTHPVGLREEDENGDMRCYDLFDIHVRAGDTIVAGQEQEGKMFSPISDTQKYMDLDIYRTSNKEPQLVTEEGCENIGQLRIPIKKRGRDKDFTVSMMFGGTEIEVKCVEKSTGKVTKERINFLE